MGFAGGDCFACRISSLAKTAFAIRFWLLAFGSWLLALRTMSKPTAFQAVSFQQSVFDKAFSNLLLR